MENKSGTVVLAIILIVLAFFAIVFRQIRKNKADYTRGSGLSHLLAPSVISICLCAICLCGASWAWFAASASTGMASIQAANYTVSVTAAVVPTKDEPEPTDESVIPPEEPTEPAGETPEPAAEATEPAEEAAAPLVGAVSEPIEEAVEPTEEAIITPVEEPTEPEESATPTEETSEPEDETETPPQEAAAPMEEAEVPISETVTPTENNGIISLRLAAGKTYAITIIPTGTAKSGYCKVIFEGAVYYTDQLTKGLLSFTVNTSAESVLTVTPEWGTCAVATDENMLKQDAEIGTKPTEKPDEPDSSTAPVEDNGEESNDKNTPLDTPTDPIEPPVDQPEAPTGTPDTEQPKAEDEGAIPEGSDSEAEAKPDTPDENTPTGTEEPSPDSAPSEADEADSSPETTQ